MALDDQERVPIRILEPEHRRHRLAHAHDLVVDVHAAIAQCGVVGVDVLAREGDPGLDPD